MDIDVYVESYTSWDPRDLVMAKLSDEESIELYLQIWAQIKVDGHSNLQQTGHIWLLWSLKDSVTYPAEECSFMRRLSLGSAKMYNFTEEEVLEYDNATEL